MQQEYILYTTTSSIIFQSSQEVQVLGLLESEIFIREISALTCVFVCLSVRFLTRVKIKKSAKKLKKQIAHFLGPKILKYREYIYTFLSLLGKRSFFALLLPSCSSKKLIICLIFQ